jgi:hypothetical protein
MRCVELVIYRRGLVVLSATSTMVDMSWEAALYVVGYAWYVLTSASARVDFIGAEPTRKRN